jgi:hypothetical protein
MTTRVQTELTVKGSGRSTTTSSRSDEDLQKSGEAERRHCLLSVYDGQRCICKRNLSNQAIMF